MIDAHHHFWDTATGRYGWLEEEGLAPIRRTFGPSDLRPLLDEQGVHETILVEAGSASLDETREFLRFAAETDFLAGVVGWVDLRAAEVSDTLAELREGAGGRSLVGIRHLVQAEPDDWLVRPDVIRGLEAVRDAGLTYDLLVLPRHLPSALEVVRRFPDIRFVIDHIAKPPIASGELEPWATRMARFGELPNVWCKLSGLITEADPQHWTPDDLRPYVERVLDWFGEDRVCFGSDWPVCLLAGSYADVVEALNTVLGPISESTRERIFETNARDLYRLHRRGRSG